MEKILKRLQARFEDLGAEYADLRYVDLDRQKLRTKEGKLEEVKDTSSRVVGFRVLKEGAFGFSATRDLSEKSLMSHLKQAAQMAQQFAKVRHAEVKLAPLKPLKRRWRQGIKKDAWKLSLAEKIAPHIAAEERLMRSLGSSSKDSASGLLDFTRKRILFLSSEGCEIEQTLYRTGGWIYGETWRDGEKLRRHWPGPSGLYRAQGYEAIEGLHFEKEVPRLAEELAALRQSPEAASGTFDLILKGSILALQIHETFGHASESDRVYGYEDNYGGRTFLNPGLLQGSPVASREVTIVSDAGGEGAGSFAFDDEGAPARRFEVIKQGVFKGYQTSRETAFFLNQPSSSANMVAEDGSHYPIIRMTNVNLLPGRGSLREMIQDTEEGLLLDNELSWSIDSMRLDFQIGAECGYRIRKGKIKGVVRFPVYHGNTLDFWKACDGVAGKREWEYWGFPDCGKGGPYQTAFTGHGLSPARFRKVRFGRE